MTVLMLKKENEQLKRGLLKVLKDGDKDKLRELLENDLFHSIADESSPSAKGTLYDIDQMKRGIH